MLDSDRISRSTSTMSNDKISELELCRDIEIKQKGVISRPSLLAEYDRSFTEYIQKIYSQDIIRMVRRISHSARIDPKFRSQSVLRLLVDSTQELMLSPFEVAVFAIYLDRFGWKEPFLSPHIMLTYVGLASKIFMEADVSHILKFLSGRIMNVEKEFKNWYKNIEEFTKINIVEINETYNGLSEISVSGIVNYSYYVDEILQISPPYKVVKKESLSNASFSLAGLNGVKILEEENYIDDLKIGAAYDRIETLCKRFVNANAYSEAKVTEENKKAPANKLLIAIALNH